jgi:hypothetical protein
VPNVRFEGRPGGTASSAGNIIEPPRIIISRSPGHRKSDFGSPWLLAAPGSTRGRRGMLFVSKWAHHFVDFTIGAA